MRRILTMASVTRSNSAVTTSGLWIATNQCYRGTYTGATQSITSASLTLNYFDEVGSTVTVDLYDISVEGGPTLASSGAVELTEGGTCDEPSTITITLTVADGAQLTTGHQLELDITYSNEGIGTVIGSGECDPEVVSQLDLGVGSSAPPAPTNECEYGLECNTAFAAFNVVSATGAPVGGATVVVSATGYASQTATTTSTASTSALCSLSPAWTAIWGAYWGCDIGTTGPFTLNSATTYTYTVTLPSGTVLTGTVGPSTTPGTSPWTVTLVTVAA